jgi:hypothetical protein
MTPELYKRWRLGLGFVTAKDLAEHLQMAAISISTYESRGSGLGADDKLLRILEQKILQRDDEFINAVVDTAIRFGLTNSNHETNTKSPDNELLQNNPNKTLEERVAELEAKVYYLENNAKLK